MSVWPAGGCSASRRDTLMSRAAPVRRAVPPTRQLGVAVRRRVATWHLTWSRRRTRATGVPAHRGRSETIWSARVATHGCSRSARYPLSPRSPGAAWPRASCGHGGCSTHRWIQRFQYRCGVHRRGVQRVRTRSRRRIATYRDVISGSLTATFLVLPDASCAAPCPQRSPRRSSANAA
jgi:hypothetical protein